MSASLELIASSPRRGRAPKAFSWILLAAAGGLMVAITGFGVPTQENAAFWPVIGFAGLAYLAERQSVRLNESIEFSVGFLPLTFTAVVFGPVPAGIVGAASMLSSLGRPYERWVVWTATRTLMGCLGGIAAQASAGLAEGKATQVAVSTAVVATIILAVDIVLGGLTLRSRGKGTFSEYLRATGPMAAAGVPIYSAIAGVLVFAYREVTPWTAVLFFIPALAAQRLFALYQEQRETSKKLEEVNRHLERANLSFATGLVATLEARDQYTAGHSLSVARYAHDIAVRLDLAEADQRLVHLCGLVHDIGKIGLPPGLLEKPGALTLEERHEMEKHSEIGERILKKVDDYGEIARVVRHHHERFDGAGYPDGITGKEIPLLSRIIAVADAYDAMTSNRPYRDAMPSQVARMRLAQSVGSQFDTAVVAAFEAILTSSGEAYRMGGRADEFPDGILLADAPDARSPRHLTRV